MSKTNKNMFRVKRCVIQSNVAMLENANVSESTPVSKMGGYIRSATKS